MKKKCICFLLIMILLTGCKASTTDLMSYKENDDSISKEILYYKDPLLSGAFASDLCIIPQEDTVKSDNNLPALSTLVINKTDNKAIYAHNIYERIYPASITKIATALVVLKHADLSDIVTFSYNASHITEPGAKLCGFKQGDQIKLQDLLTSLLVYSGNDAGVAIAEHVGGSVEGFAEMMNEEVRSLGAVDSHFVNPHGLHDDNHYTTAYDLYLIFQKLIQDERFVKIIHTAKFTAHYTTSDGKNKSMVFLNTNRYLKGTERMPDGITVVGGKTGTTNKAGSCLILYSKDREGKDYISLVLKADNGDSLFHQMTYLLKLIP